MPIYEYVCTNCDYTFSVKQSMKKYKKKKKCPSCGKYKLERMLGAPSFFIKGEPKALGHWAERNTQKMGRYELEDKRRLDGESKKNSDKEKDSKYSNKDIQKMSDVQRKKFIESGE